MFVLYVKPYRRPYSKLFLTHTVNFVLILVKT